MPQLRPALWSSDPHEPRCRQHPDLYASLSPPFRILNPAQRFPLVPGLLTAGRAAALTLPGPSKDHSEVQVSLIFRGAPAPRGPHRGPGKARLPRRSCQAARTLPVEALGLLSEGDLWVEAGLGWGPQAPQELLCQ